MGGIKLNGTLLNPGSKDINILKVTVGVSEGETSTIGADVYEIDTINTASGDTTANGSWNNTTSPLTVDLTVADYPNLSGTLSVGNQISIDNEILYVTAVSGTNVTFARGDSATTNDVHADAVAINIGDGVTAGNIPVGLIASFNPQDYTNAFAAQINSYGTEKITGTAYSLVAAEIVGISTDFPGSYSIACATTLANGEWLEANTYGGIAAGLAKLIIQKRVPTANEVTLGSMIFSFDFSPVVLSVMAYVTSTKGVSKDWNGATTVSGNDVIISNNGATDWAATDTIILTVTE